MTIIDYLLIGVAAMTAIYTTIGSSWDGGTQASGRTKVARKRTDSTHPTLKVKTRYK